MPPPAARSRPLPPCRIWYERPKGGLIAQFASMLDGVDGEVARIRYQDSFLGGVTDALLGRIGDAR